MVHVPNFWGVRFGGQGWGRQQYSNHKYWEGGDKSFIEFLKKWGGGEGDEWQQYFDFSYITGSKQNATSKNCILGYFFYSHV